MDKFQRVRKVLPEELALVAATVVAGEVSVVRGQLEELRRQSASIDVLTHAQSAFVTASPPGVTEKLRKLVADAARDLDVNAALQPVAGL
eukprot:8400492-Lingulodinium_polyedra.AAC.1